MHAEFLLVVYLLCRLCAGLLHFIMFACLYVGRLHFVFVSALLCWAFVNPFVNFVVKCLWIFLMISL